MEQFARQAALSIREEIVRWRRDLHRIPETGLILPQTAAYVKACLNEMGLSYREYSDHSGLVVDIGRPGGKVVAVRADMTPSPSGRRPVWTTPLRTRICMPAAMTLTRPFFWDWPSC